jgi:hypothetical protein
MVSKPPSLNRIEGDAKTAGFLGSGLKVKGTGILEHEVKGIG